VAAEDVLNDVLLGHRVALERHAVHIVRDVTSLLERAEADARARLAALEASGRAPATRARVEELVTNLQRMGDAAREAMDSKLSGHLRALAEYEGRQATALHEGVRVGWNLDLPTADKLIAIVTEGAFQGRVMRDLSARLETGIKDRIDQEVRIGMAQGEGVRGIVSRLFGAGGIGARTKRDAERIVRTAVAHVHAKSHEEVYLRNPTLFERVAWAASLDNRTCMTCAGLHAREWRADDPSRPTPPEHWNCRCSLLYLARGEEARLPDFDEWAGRQDDKTLAEIFGKTRAALFRQGRLKTRDMLDFKTLRPLTLEQLKAKDVTLFEARGLPTRRLPPAEAPSVAPTRAPISGDPLGPIAEAARPVVVDGSKFLRGSGDVLPRLRQVADDADYVYHGTSQEAAIRIAGDRLNRSTPGRGRKWADGSDEKRNFWSPTGTTAWNWTNEDAPALIRVRRTDVELFDNQAEGGYFSRSSVSSKKLEFLGADGTWRPMAELAGDKPITPTTKPPPVVAPPPVISVQPATDAPDVAGTAWEGYSRANRILLDQEFGWLSTSENFATTEAFESAPTHMKALIRRSEPVVAVSTGPGSHATPSFIDTKNSDPTMGLTPTTSRIQMGTFSSKGAYNVVYRHEYGHHLDVVLGSLTTTTTYASASERGVQAALADRAFVMDSTKKRIAQWEYDWRGIGSADQIKQRALPEIGRQSLTDPTDVAAVRLRVVKELIDEKNLGVSGADVMEFFELTRRTDIKERLRTEDPAMWTFNFFKAVANRQDPTRFLRSVYDRDISNANVSSALPGQMFGSSTAWNAVNMMDFVGALTNEEIGAGHGKAYYTSAPNLTGDQSEFFGYKNGTELFANYVSMLGTNTAASRVGLWLMKTMAPNVTKFFDDAIEAGIQRRRF
jgi:SPP1 gp7 family putative phage head morphogenesis protein